MVTVNFKTLTNAYKARSALLREGIYSELISVDASKTKKGCAYGLRIVSGSEREVRRILFNIGVEHGDIS